MTVNSSVIAGSGGTDCGRGGGTVTLNTAWIQDGTCASAGGFNLGLTGDPKLGALGNNGGPTQTHLPAADSPLIGAGNTTATLDQRGVARDAARPVIGAVTDGDGAAGAMAAAIAAAAPLGNIPCGWV